MTDKFNSKEYKISRNAYIAQCTFEYFISLLVTDAYLAKLLSYEGISDSMIGIISSIASLAFLFQLSAIFLVQHIKRVKRTTIIFDSLFQVMHIALYAVPFLPLGKTIKTGLIVSFILIGYLCKYELI